MKQEEFIELVIKMRRMQNVYFSTRDRKALTEARKYEKAVDAAIADYQSGAQNLF